MDLLSIPYTSLIHTNNKGVYKPHLVNQTTLVQGVFLSSVDWMGSNLSKVGGRGNTHRIPFTLIMSIMHRNYILLGTKYHYLYDGRHELNNRNCDYLYNLVKLYIMSVSYDF